MIAAKKNRLKNHILKSLPVQELELLTPHLERVELEQRRVLYDVGQRFDYIYFLEAGINSVLSTMEDGATIEVGMVGFEGLTPVAAFLGEKMSQQRNVMQLPGNGHRISILHCKRAFEEAPLFQKMILQFANSQLNLSAQTAACNSLHPIEQRFARWLLMSQDRFESDVLPLTQEYISSMIGVRRVGITQAAGKLQRDGLIDYNRGQITILNRGALEETACELLRR